MGLISSPVLPPCEVSRQGLNLSYSYCFSMGRNDSRRAVLSPLMGGEALSCREIMSEAGLSTNVVYKAVDRCWRRGLVLRTDKTIPR